MNIAEEFADQLQEAGNRLGKSFQASSEEIREYAAARLLHLSALVGQAGYMEALIAERDNVALKVGILAVDRADEADREIIGFIGGALAIGARALAG